MQHRAEITKNRILQVAEEEFSEKGFYGSRVDEIASKADVNKALIYKYFGSKEELYKTIFSIVYERFSQLERTLFVGENCDFKERLRRLVELNFRFLKENPTYIRMLMWENLNNAQYYKEKNLGSTKSVILENLDKLLADARKNFSVPDEINSKQLLMTLYGCGFNYFSNSATMKGFIGENMLEDDVIEERINSIVNMLMAYKIGRAHV